jgi:hypothetical protein
LPDQLEKYGQQGFMGGWITSFIEGKTLLRAEKDGTWLILVFTDGHRAKIGFQDTHGNQLKGEPFIENLDVKIQLVGASLSGKAGP